MFTLNQVIRGRFRNRAPQRTRAHGPLVPRALGLAVGVLLAATGCSSFTAQSHNATGVRLFDRAQYQEALKEFQEANYIDPNNPDGCYNLARTYHRLGKVESRQLYLDQADSYYRQCLAKGPNHRECYRGLAVLLAEQGHTDEAFDLIEGWAAGAPSSADAKVELARLDEEYGDRGEAKEHLIDALKIDPQNARALAALGKIREDTGEHAEALRNYQRSLACDRFQPQVATRVAALQTAVSSPVSMRTVRDGTRLVDRSPVSLR